ncbi:MAG: nucleoside-diphosphate sugar epimerase/dehydratase [Sulfuricurvum sp.]|nr:nucleoside-diphosphate sugar epimerase/dehydratase [Sulfuricurvum sp.]
MRSWLTPSSAKRISFFILADTFLSLITLYVAYLLRFNFQIPDNFLTSFWSVFVTLFGLKLFTIALFKNYTIIWRFFALGDARALFQAHLVSYGLFTLIYILFPEPFSPFPRSVIIIDFLLSFTLLGLLRFSKRLILESRFPSNTHKPTLIIGISSNTSRLIQSTLEDSSDYYPIGIVAVQEKNQSMIGSTIQTIKISSLNDIPSLIETKKITSAIIDGSLPNEQLRQLYQHLSDRGIHDIKRSSVLSEGKSVLKEFSIEELLARHPKDLDTATIGKFIQNKIILITGAGGSIGSEIALQCHRFGAKKLILIDNSEYNLYQIGEKLPSSSLHLTNILDREALDTLIRSSKPDILLHAAAYKHVPLCEANIHAAITNNIQGSRNVIDSAIAHNVSKVVIISTDKAVRPTNVMGATKRVVELYAQNVNPHNSEIVSVRFGNVLGSSGSVIPKFKSQIESGGPITLTHPDITRYFMLTSEACQLVLQAAAIARGGELFILDMGEPIKILDLARTMIRLYTTEPIEIVMSGLRPGEKLYEELLIDESEQKTVFESILIAHSTPYPIAELNADIENLLTSGAAIKALQKIVPEFQPSDT